MVLRIFVFFLIYVASALTGSLCSSLDAQDTDISEYEVKAAFIYNMAKFIDWPSYSKDSIGLCIFGADPFGKSIEGIRGKMVKGKKLDIRKTATAGELKECQMVFISASEKDQVRKVTDLLKDSAILTIGDTDGFIGHGVMINFYFEGKKVRFEANPDRARQARVTISSQLLKLAKITGESSR
jgi:hypothetical protein